MLNMFLPEVMELVRDHGGQLEKNTGDGILAYFGSEGLDLVSVNDTLSFIASVKLLLANYVNPILEDNGIETITISTGAAYGTVYISRIGAHSGNQQMNRLTAVSVYANIASKLESMAGKNEYFVDDDINDIALDNMWGQYIFQRGIIPGYSWTNSDGYTRQSQYYNFNGVWKGTNTENLQ